MLFSCRLVGFGSRARRGRVMVLAALGSCLLLFGCSSDPPLGQTIGPNGGVIFGEDGSAVGVAAGLLTSTVTIEVAPVSDPGVPLPTDVTPHGTFVEVGASDEVQFSGSWGGFLVGVPVPQGVATDHLGLAALVPAGAEEHAGSAYWAIRHGVFYAPRRLLLAAVPSLSPQGTVVRLVSAAFLSSPEAEQPSSALPKTQQGGVPAWPSGFVVIERDPVPAPGTNAATFFQAALDKALTTYRDAGFLPFALETTGGDLWLEPPSFGAEPSELKFLAYTRAYFSDPNGNDPDSRCEMSTGVVANYSFLHHELMLCAPVDPANYTDPQPVDQLTRNAYHELFHAVQKAYFVDRHANPGIKYFKEGTASLAEMFLYGPEVQPTPDYGPRAVEPALTDISGTRHYRVQDFWLHVANRHGLTFPQLTLPFLQAGDAVPAVVDAVLHEPPFASSLAEEYRLWAQHQSYDLTACDLRDVDGDGQADTVTNLVDLGTVGVADGAEPTFPAAHAVTLPALSTSVIRFALLNNRGVAYSFRARVTDDLALDADPVSSRVAAIEDTFVACTFTPGAAFEPASTGDGATKLEFEVDAGNATTVYVIIANDRLEVPVLGNLVFEPLPELEWTFDTDLEGWLSGIDMDGGSWGSASWQDYCGTGRPAGCVKLDGVGGPDVANAWIYRTVDLPADATTLRLDTSAHNRDGADSEYRVRLVDQSAAEHVLIPWTTTAGSEGVFHWSTVLADVSAYAGTTVTIYLEGGDNAPGAHEQRYFDNVAIE